MKRPERCGNCGAYLPEKHQFCIYCGTKAGEGNFEFNPEDDKVQILYGAPVICDCDCKNCGKQWTSVKFGGINRTKYCPVCGSEIQKTKISLEEFKKRIDKNKI